MNVEKHPIIRDLFVIDVLYGAKPIYEIDQPDVSAVVLECKYDEGIPNISLGIRNGAYRGSDNLCRMIVPTELNQRIDYDLLEEKLVECLIHAAHINGNYFKSIKDVERHYKTYDLDMYGTIIPDRDTDNYKVPSCINAAMLLGDGKRPLHKSKFLTDRCIIVPPQEYLGVCAIDVRGRRKIAEDTGYGIAVINSRGVCILA